MSKRVKINFQSCNEGKYTVIDPKVIAEVNKRIKENMEPIIRDFQKKQYESWLSSNKIKGNG